MITQRKIINALRRTEKYIRQGWTRGQLAKDSKGNVVSPYGKLTCSFCLLGALQRACSFDSFLLAETAQALTRELPSTVSWRCLTYFNDSQTNKYPIIRLIQRAIQSAKSS